MQYTCLLRLNRVTHTTAPKRFISTYNISNDIEDHRKLLELIEKQLNIKLKNDWYKITIKVKNKFNYY